MTRARPASSAEQTAFRQFIEAVVALSEDPEPANVERYLAASRELEESQRSRQTPPRARRRTRGAGAAVRTADA
jgi:hypothetical protein